MLHSSTVETGPAQRKRSKSEARPEPLGLLIRRDRWTAPLDRREGGPAEVGPALRERRESGSAKGKGDVACTFTRQTSTVFTNALHRPCSAHPSFQALTVRLAAVPHRRHPPGQHAPDRAPALLLSREAGILEIEDFKDPCNPEILRPTTSHLSDQPRAHYRFRENPVLSPQLVTWNPYKPRGIPHQRCPFDAGSPRIAPYKP